MSSSLQSPSHHHRAVTARDVFRYRAQCGATYSGGFVLERSQCPGMFDQAANRGDELDAVVASLVRDGLDATRHRWESHWASTLSNMDAWHQDRTWVKHFRLPIGFYMLGPRFCRNTPFAMEAANVYVRAWDMVKQLCQHCCERGLGVLLVLELPRIIASSAEVEGNGNDDKATFSRSMNRALVIRCLGYMAQQVKDCFEFDSVIGIQVSQQTFQSITEQAERGRADLQHEIINRLSKIDATLPIYIGDGGNLPAALEWSKTGSRNEFPFPTTTHSCPVVVVLEQPGAVTPDAMFHFLLPTDLNDHPQLRAWPSPKLRWLGSQCTGTVTDIHGAVAMYERSPCMPLTSADLVDSSFRLPSSSLTIGTVRGKLERADQRRTMLMTTAMQRHIDYFTAVGGKYEHWRYADGWHRGFADARAFFASGWDRHLAGVEKQGCQIRDTADADHKHEHDSCMVTYSSLGIGLLSLWVLKRMQEQDEVERDRCEFVWEWEYRMRDGVKAFEHVVGLGPPG